MSDDEPDQYAERMFPAPVDLGIAEADRAVSSVPLRHPSATSRAAGGDGHELVRGRRRRRRPTPCRASRSTRRPRGSQTQGDPFEPVKIGDPHRHGPRPAARRLDRPDDPRHRGRAQRRRLGPQPGRSSSSPTPAACPGRTTARCIDGYRWLVEQGCVVVLGPMISRQLARAPGHSPTSSGWPCIGWTGAHKFASEYCFTVANGDIPTEGVMCAQWLKAAGPREGRPVLGGRARRARTTPTTSATPRCSSA